MSPRTGRPTDNPKNHETRIRMSDTDIERLNYCCKTFGLPKAEIIRRGVAKMYEEAQKQK